VRVLLVVCGTKRKGIGMPFAKKWVNSIVNTQKSHLQGGGHKDIDRSTGW